MDEMSLAIGFFEGRVLLVPERIVDFIESRQYRKKKRDEYTYLVWYLIADRQSGKKFAKIHSDEFTRICSSATAESIKKELVDGGFLERDGKWSKGHRSQGYRVLCKGSRRLVYLRLTSLNSIYGKRVDQDEACAITRDVLGRVTLDVEGLMRDLKAGGARLSTERQV